MSLQLKLRRASRMLHFSVFFCTSPDQRHELEPRPRAPVERLNLYGMKSLDMGRSGLVWWKSFRGFGVVGPAGAAGFSCFPRAPRPWGAVRRQLPTGLINTNIWDVGEWGGGITPFPLSVGGKGFVLSLPMLANRPETAPNLRVNAWCLLTPAPDSAPAPQTPAAVVVGARGPCCSLSDGGNSPSAGSRGMSGDIRGFRSPASPSCCGAELPQSACGFILFVCAESRRIPSERMPVWSSRAMERLPHCSYAAAMCWRIITLAV